MNPPGRPRKFDSPEQFDAAVDSYVSSRDGGRLTWTGLALHLGFCSRVSIDEYLKYEGFSYSVKRAKLLVENSYEESLGGDGSPAGSIFALKNFGWSDKQEVEHSGSVGHYETMSEEEIDRRIAALAPGED